MKQFNLRLFGVLVAIVVVFGTGIYFLHGFQVKRNAHVFLDEARRSKEQAEQAKADKNIEKAREAYNEAFKNYGEYLKFAPDDLDALEEYGLLLADLQRYNLAFTNLEKLLRQAQSAGEDRPKVRRRLVDLAIELGQLSQTIQDAAERSRQTARWFGVARDHLENYLLQESPDDAELLELLGRCQAASGEYAAAAKSFRRAIDSAPHLVEAYPRLAGLLRLRLSRAKEADQWMEKLVNANADSYTALLLSAAYLRENGSLEEAQEQAVRALDLADKALAKAEDALKANPNDPSWETKRDAASRSRRQGLLLAARCALEGAHRSNEEQKKEEGAEEYYQRARQYVERGIALYPEDAEMYTTLADIEIRAGVAEKASRADRAARAVAALRKGLAPTQNAPDILWKMANLLVDTDRTDEASKVLEQLRDVKVADPLLSVLQGRICFARGDWSKAIKSFDEARSGLSGLAPWAHLVKQVDVWLGRCYGELGNPDQEQAAYRRAINADPNFSLAKAYLAQSLLNTGMVENAWMEYQKMKRLGKTPAGAAIPLARMLVLKNLRLNPAQRDWSQAEILLGEVAKSEPGSTQIPLLQSEILVAQNRVPDAEELLRKARDKAPDKVELWTQLASLAQRAGDWKQVESLLDEAEQKLKQPGDKVDLRLARARYLVRRYGAEAKKQLRELAEVPAESFSDADRVKLWNGVLNAAVQVGDIEEGRILCQRIADKQPNNVQVRFMLFELALQANDDTGMQKALADVQSIEGKGPLWHYGEAVRLSLLARNSKGSDSRLDEALPHLARARELRPSWSRVPLLAAGIYDQQRNSARALENYLRAIELGDYNTVAIRRAAQLLSQQGRFSEARDVIHVLEQRQVPLSPELERIKSPLDLQGGDVDSALELARKGALDSKDFRQHIWLGQVLDVKRRQVQAEGNSARAQQLMGETEQALRHAVDLSSQTAETWVPLVRFLGGTEQRDKAQEAIQQAREKLPPDQAPLALAQCYEAIGEFDPAQEQYAGALAAAPNNPSIVRTVAEFYWRIGKYKQAEDQLQRIIEGEVQAQQADVMWARRLWALILLNQGRYQSLQKAQELTEQNLKLDPSSIQDRRLMATILAAIPGHTADAARLFEEIIRGRQAAVADDKYNLAKLYLAQGNRPKFNSTMVSLLSEHGDDPRYLQTYVSALLDREPETAESWLERLEKVAPDQFATVSLRAELLFRRGKYEQTIDLLKGFVDRPAAQPPDRASRLRLAGERLEQFPRQIPGAEREVWGPRFVREAELLFRRYVDERPSQEVLLVAFLARLGLIDDSLNVLERIWPRSNPVMLAQVSVPLLRAEKISSEQLQRGEKILQAALKKYDRPIPLLLVLADAYTTYERYDEAEPLYREILQKNETNPVALNNLAVLFAFQRVKLDEALRLVNRAMEISGPVGSMLDTRATVYLALGQPDKALADLKEALAESATPVRLFHQAQAYDQARDEEHALDALKKAQKAGLTAEMLQPPERRAYKKLLKLLQ